MSEKALGNTSERCNVREGTGQHVREMQCQRDAISEKALGNTSERCNVREMQCQRDAMSGEEGAMQTLQGEN